MSKTQAATPASLKAQPREKLGTRPARYLRAAGMIPAALAAGEGKGHVDLAIDEHEFLASRRRHQHVYELDLGAGRETTLVRELQWDVFGERITHVEFRRVDLTKQTEVDVEIAFIGHPKGQLNHLMTHIKVRALPTDIPDVLEVSVADLEPGTNVKVSDIKVPKGIELITPSNLFVARISVIKVEILESAAVTAAAAAEGAVAAAVPAEGATALAPAGAAPAKGAAAAAPGKGGAAAAPAAGAAAPAKGGAPAPGKKPEKK